MSGLALEEAHAAVERIARQHHDEDHALQHQHRRIRQSEPPLQQAAGRADATEQNRDRDHGERILPREKGHQDSGKAVPRRQVGVGSSLHRRK